LHVRAGPAAQLNPAWLASKVKLMPVTDVLEGTDRGAQCWVPVNLVQNNGVAPTQ
jgi:hypothetical protein